MRSALGKLTEENPRLFLRSFALFGILGLFVVAGINLAVDPYGQYGTGLREPIVRTTRGKKMQLLRVAAKSEEPVEGLILGSSRVMKFEPSHLRKRTGLKYFNAGVYYGRTEDFLAILKQSRHVLGYWPKALLIGIDVDSFITLPGPDPELMRIAPLRTHVDHLLQWSDRTRSLQELLSWQQTANSIRSLHYGLSGLDSLPEEEAFTPCGTIQYLRREREIAEGTYDFASAYAFTRQEYLRMYRQYEQVDAKRRQAWQEIVELCRQHSIQLDVFLTPWLPELSQELISKTDYMARKRQVIDLLGDSLELGGLSDSARIWDFTNVDSFGGDSSDFIDGIHPLEMNTRLMVDKIFSDPRQSDLARN